MERLNNGYLELILGPMFSGKTSKLIEIYKQYSFCNIPLVVINYEGDTRYSPTDLVTHDKVKINCIQSDNLLAVINEQIDVFTNNGSLAVLINEGQFFSDLYSSVYQMVNEHKCHVYVAGLDGDFKREKFGQMLDLIPICDKVYKLHSLCVFCKDGTKAIFSHRKDKKCKSQKQIGTDDIYVPLCRECYKSNQ